MIHYSNCKYGLALVIANQSYMYNGTGDVVVGHKLF
jgi:hypothetical protein